MDSSYYWNGFIGVFNMKCKNCGQLSKDHYYKEKYCYNIKDFKLKKENKYTTKGEKEMVFASLLDNKIFIKELVGEELCQE